MRCFKLKIFQFDNFKHKMEYLQAYVTAKCQMHPLERVLARDMYNSYKAYLREIGVLHPDQDFWLKQNFFTREFRKTYPTIIVREFTLGKYFMGIGIIGANNRPYVRQPSYQRLDRTRDHSIPSFKTRMYTELKTRMGLTTAEINIVKYHNYANFNSYTTRDGVVDWDRVIANVRKFLGIEPVGVKLVIIDPHVINP